MLLNYKLSDKTQTALHLAIPPTLRLFTRSCITSIGPNVWRVPPEAVPKLLRRHATHTPMCGKPTGANRVAVPMEADPGIAVAIKDLLRQQGHPDGQLALSRDGGSYRWDTLDGLALPCLAAQIWRPARPTHMSNGARVSIDSAGLVPLHNWPYAPRRRSRTRL